MFVVNCMLMFFVSCMLMLSHEPFISSFHGSPAFFSSRCFILLTIIIIPSSFEIIELRHECLSLET